MLGDRPGPTQFSASAFGAVDYQPLQRLLAKERDALASCMLKLAWVPLCSGMTWCVGHRCGLLCRQASTPRGIAARGFEKSKGARAPKRCDPVATNGQPSAPAPVACRAEGAVTSSAGSSVRLGALRPSLSRPEPRAAAHPNDGAPLRDGRPCSLLPGCTASIRGPGICGELSLASDARDGTDACLNRAPPPPRKAAQLMRPMMGRGAESMGEVGGGGDKFVGFPVGPEADISQRRRPESARDPGHRCQPRLTKSAALKSCLRMIN